MNSRALLVFAIVALAAFQTPGRVKADGAQTRPTDVQPSAPVNGLRGYLQIYGRKTYDSYHPGEPFECGGVVQDVAGRPIEIAVGRNCYSSLYVRVPDGRLFIEPAQFRGQKDPPRFGIEQLAPKNSVVVYLLRGHLNDHLQGWIDGRTFQSDTDVSFREPGKYTFWFEYEVPNGNPAVWSGKLESNRITLTVTDLPPAQRLQKPTPAQLDDLKTFLASSRSIRPRPAAAEMADAMRQTENEGLAIYLVGQLDQSPEHADELLYLLAQRVIGIDGPYLKSLANWCIEILEHGNPPKSFQSYGGLIGDVTQYLHFHPTDMRMRERMIAVATQSANVSKFLNGGRIRAPLPYFRPLSPNGPLFIGFESAWSILIDLKALHDGMSIAEATEILGPPSEQDATWITWVYPSSARRQPRLSAEAKDGKLNNFR